MTQISNDSQWIMLEGAFNVRDTGGYPADNGVTCQNALLRADSLHKLTNTDQDILMVRGLRTVIDLRHSTETDVAPNVFEQSSTVTYLQMLVFEVQPDVSSAVVDLPTIYRYIVDSCQTSLLKTLQSIARAPEGAVLVHCTAGKDRTGVVTALALSAVGVPREFIVTDFAMTTEAMNRLRPRLLANATLSPEALKHLEKMLGSEPDLMDDLLDYLDVKYGGVDAYLTHIGFSSNDRDLLRNRLIQAN